MVLKQTLKPLTVTSGKASPRHKQEHRIEQTQRVSPYHGRVQGARRRRMAKVNYFRRETSFHKVFQWRRLFGADQVSAFFELAVHLHLEIASTDRNRKQV